MMIGEAVGGVKFVAGRRHAGRRDGRRRESIEIYEHGWKQNGRDGGRHGLVVLLEYMRRRGAEWEIRG